MRPWAVRFFERQWLVNAILFGNYVRLRDAALEIMGARLPGKTLQIACVYGDMTCRLAERVAAGGGRLDVVDVLPVQIENLHGKLPKGRRSADWSRTLRPSISRMGGTTGRSCFSCCTSSRRSGGGRP